MEGKLGGSRYIVSGDGSLTHSLETSGMPY